MSVGKAQMMMTILLIVIMTIELIHVPSLKDSISCLELIFKTLLANPRLTSMKLT